MALLDEQKSKTQINSDIKDLEKLVRKLKLTATLAKGTTKTELNQTIKQLESQLRQIKLQARIDNRQLNREINNALRNVSARDINLNINSNGERLNAQVRRAVSQAREFAERNPISINIDLKREKLLNQLTAFTNKHTKINESSYWLGEAERLRTVISSVTNRDELRNATDQLQVFTSGVRATGYAAVSTTDRIKGMLGNIIKVGNYFGLAFVAVNKFRQSLNTLKTNDTILTEISKTSEMTKLQLRELGNEAFKVASKYGQSSGNYLLGVQEMARSGYEMISKELGELSLLAQSAGDMTADSANNYLLATDAAYKYGGSVEKLNAALDGANYISNKNSANLSDIADATRVSASFAANAGVAIDELTAAEATMIAVTKRGGSEIGRAFRSIVLNLQQVSGEFDGEVIDEEQLKKVEDRCHSLGVELEYIKDGVPTLRNTMDVLKDLAEVYNSLPENSAEKQGLIADIGGKYYANALSALLSRWDMYEKMLGEYSQGAGSALEEANKTADSWEGRLAQLQNSWDSFVNTLTNKDVVKGGVSFLDNTIQAFEKLADTVGALPVMLTSINASMAALNKNYGITQIYNKSTHKIDLQGNFMGIDITAYKTQIKHFREASEAIEEWNDMIVNSAVDVNTFNNATVQSNEQLRAYLQTTSVDAPASLNGYRAYLNATGQSTDALRLKTVLMTSAMSIGFSFALQAVFQLIQSGVTVIDNWIHRVEKANEAMNEAVSEYESAKSSLENINSELAEQNKKINELLSKDKLTYAEKGQLEELQGITRELLLQQDIEQKRAEKASKDAASKAVDAYNKQYGKYDISREELKEKSENAKISGIFPIVDSTDDITGNIVAYIRATEILTEAQQNYEESLKSGIDTKYLDDDIQNTIDAVNEYSEILNENISDLQQKRLALEDEYNRAVEKRELGVEPLTSSDKDVIKTYKSIYDAIKLIYEYTNKNDWNNMEISNIFNTEGIEKTKEELISMYKSGELSSAKMLEQFPKLNQAIKESEIIAGENSDRFKEFFYEIAALAEGTENTISGVLDKANTSLSITDTVDQLNTQLKPAFDSLKSAYQNIFTYDKSGKKSFSLDNLGIDTFESIRAELEKLGEIDGITVDYTPFERFVSVLSDTSSTADEVQAQFDNLATSIIYTTDCTNISAETYDLLVQSLTEMGVTNAEEVLYNLKGIQEELVASGYDVANITAQEAGELINLGSVSAQTTEYLRSYLLQKELAQNPLNTISDITALENLCNSLGVTGKLYEYVIDLKRAFDAKEHGAVSEGLDQSIEQLKGKIASLSNGQADFKFKFSKPETAKSSSKSQKDTNKEFDWIEQAIENAEKEVKKLEDIVNSAYTTFFEKSQALAQEIEKLNEEIGLQQQAYDEYMRKAESIGLSDDYKALVRDGAIQIDDISDEKLQTAITDYQKWYEKAVSVSDKITELQEKVKDLNAKDYEQQSDSLQRSQEKNLITMTEYYRSMMALQDKYYNNEATKLKDLANKMQTEYGRMNSLKLTRDSVDASTIQAAGYTTALQSSSVYAQSFGNETKQVVVTPILPDGTILSPDTLAEYANRLLNGEQIDADIELAIFEGNDAAIQTANYINGLEMMQTEYQNLKKTFSENLYDNFTEKQLEAIEKLTEEIEKHKSQLSSELGDIKSAYDDLKEIRDTYNKYGKISVDQYQSLCDMGFEYLALLSDESGALSLDEDAFQRLTDAKIQQIQVDMALQAADLIKNIQTEEQAVQYLAASYENLASNALSAAEQMLYAAQANAQLMYGADSLQAKAANTIVKGYENSKLLAGNIDIKMKSGGGYDDKEDKADEIDWGEKILDSVDRGLEKTERTVEKISDKTDKLIDKAEKFFSWQKKNAMINRAVKSSDKEIKANEKEISKLLSAVKRVQSVSNLYSQKLNSIDLSGEYKNKIQNGTLEIENIADESLKNTISEYEKWYDKLNNCKDKMNEYNDAIQECRDSVSELYEQQRDLIKQKLENVLSYYSDMDSYLSSITSKLESLISLNDEMGKRSSLTELVEQFASLSDQINSTTQKEVTSSAIVTEGSLGDSKKVADAVNRDRQELADSIQKQIDNLSVDQSGTYTKLLKDIAKTEAQIDKYIDKGWDVKKAKQFEKLTQKLQNYYDLQNELDQNATSNTVGNYSKIYTAYQKLKNKSESGKDLNKSEQKKFDSYEKQLADLKNRGQNSLDKLYGQLAEANGTAPKKSEADKIKEDISEIHSDVENSATYQNLLKDIEKVEDKLAKLDEKGYDNLSKSQKKTYDKLQSQLEGYYEQKESLDQNATAANIAEYNKIYLAWKKLQNKLDKGGNLSVNDWKKYNSYTEQLENYAKEKAETLDNLNDDLAEALDPSDKLETIQKTYEESAEGIYESYQNQIKSINGEAINTQQYQNLYAKAQKLEQKKDTKGLSKSEQAQLDKYNAELEALQKGAMGTNISEYMKTWESLYKLQQKLDNGKKLSANEAKNYDTYKAQLEAWNNAKQTQIRDLLSQMEDDLAQLQQTHTENVSEAESQVSDYYANLYQLAKQIAEYNTTTLKTQLEYLDSMIGYYKELVSLYDTFSGEKLTKLLTDLDENVVKSKVEIYGEYLDTLQNKYNTTLSEMNEYQQLLDALDTNDFQSSMDLFDKAMESYKASGDIVMADKLQSVLDLLNERAIDADNWGEFADKWAEEWTKEFSSAKQEVIGTANEIQKVSDALRNAKFENITNAISDLDTAKEILSSITNLIQDEWLYDQGELSEYGQAKVALLVSQLEDAQKKANAYLDLYNEIQNNKDTYASDKAYMEDLNNALQNYYNTLGESATLENSILELMRRSAQEELDNLKSIIEARKKALQKKKEYYDYDKNLKNRQKEIDSIKAQIAALESLTGTMDAATKAKLTQLKADLAEKEDSLQETKDEHTYNLQIDALDEFAASLEDALDNSTKSLAEIMKEYENGIKEATDIYKTSIDSVNGTLDKIKELYGGTGTVTDGVNIDLTPKDTENNKANNTIPSINTTPSTNSNETPNTVKGDVDDVDLIIKQNMIKAAELFEKYGAELTSPEWIFKVNDQHMFELVNRQFSSMNANYNIPDYIKNNNEQSVVINNHYDSLITVEGSVDKSFSKELTQNTDTLYKKITDRMYKEARLVSGSRPVRRSIL